MLSTLSSQFAHFIRALHSDNGRLLRPARGRQSRIFLISQNMALIQRTGGGTDSRDRPKGSVVSRVGLLGPGVLHEDIRQRYGEYQAGREEKGRQHGGSQVDHPDILDFITAKLEEGELRNFNLSVGITDAFMEALERDGTYELIDPRSRGVSGQPPGQDVLRRSPNAHGGPVTPACSFSTR